MSDLKLVAPDQPTPLERMLMESVKNEAPSTEQRMRVREALGLSAVAVVPSVAAPKAAARISTAGKVAIGSVIGASAIAALFFSGVLRHPAAPAQLKPTPVAAVTAPVVAAAPPAAEPVISPLPPVEDATTASAPAPKSSAKAAVSSVSKTPAPADSASDLSEQLRLIDGARSAVAAGNASAASQALSSYSSKFPHGSFGQEAQVLRIETVDMQGNHAQAAALAKSFLAQHPNSPHVSLVQRIAGHAN